MGYRIEHEDLTGGFFVGDWLAEPMRNRLSNNGEGVQVEPKVMGVLMCLARYPGRTVTKDTFFQEVWEDTIVSEDVLSRCISELRRVLNDDAREPRFIETIRKTGYRLIAGVAPYPPQEDIAVATRQSSPGWASGSVQQATSSKKRGRLVTRIAVAMVVFGSVSLTSILIYQTLSNEYPVRHFVGPLQTVPYTNYRGLELDPALSPNGDQVAFAWDDDMSADFDIYLKQTGAESPLRLTDNAASERFPTWSPDGLRLAFVRSTESSDAVFSIPSIGGQERKLVDFGRRRIRGLSWAPDRRLLAVSAQSEVGGAAALYLVRLDSSRFIQLTQPPMTHLGDIAPSFAPDGASLAFVRSLSSDVQDVYVMTLSTKTLHAVTADSMKVSGVDWMPNSRSIVFASGRGYMSSLWRSQLPNGSPQWIVTASLGNELEHPSIARQTSRLIYVRRSGSTNIWRLTGLQSGQPETRPVIFTTGWDSHPAVSPDGRRLAFISDQTGRPEVWVSDLNGRSLVQLTSKIGRPMTPSWSPDGTTLAFALRRSGQADVYLIDAEGGNLRQITRSGTEEVHPQWSADGKWIVYPSDQTGQWQLWRMRIDDLEPEQITQSDAVTGVPDYGGRYLYFVRPGRKGIWRQSWTGPPAEPELIVDDLEVDDLTNWTVTRKGIFYLRRVHPGAWVAFYSFDSLHSNDLYYLDLVPYGPAFSASADGQYVVYAQRDEDAGDIQMVDVLE